MKIRNVFIIFVVSGFWHGANWTFVAWGALNAIYFLPLLLTKNNRKHTNIAAENKYFPTFKELLQIVVTFILIAFAWIFFRAENIHIAFDYIENMLMKSVQYPSILLSFNTWLPYKNMFILIVILVLIKWFQRKKEHGLEFTTSKTPKFIRWILYLTLIVAILYFKQSEQQQFIYFQF